MDSKPRYGRYEKDRDAPLFIRVVNGRADAHDIAQGLLKGTKDPTTKELAETTDLSQFDISLFVQDMKALLRDLKSEGLTKNIINYLDDYMSVSLLMHDEDSSAGISGRKGYWLSIKDAEAPWVEAIVCYNLSAYLKLYGHNGIQECPACRKFFVQGKMKYKFCSESCKIRGDHA